MAEVLRILTDDDLVNGLLKKEQIKEGMLSKIHDARLEFGTVVDQLCKPEVYLMRFTYHMMVTMTLIDQEIRVIRSIDLAWRPRGAINRTPDETEKQTNF